MLFYYTFRAYRSGFDILEFAFKAMGMAVSGTVKVEESAVRLDAKIPMAAMMFKGMIEQQIRKELDGVLA